MSMPSLQGAGGDHPPHLAAGHGPLDLPALLRQKPGPVGTDEAPHLRRQALGPDVDQFGELARLGEADGVETLPDGLGKDVGRGDRGAARGVEEEKVPPGMGRAAFRNDINV